MRRVFLIFFLFVFSILLSGCSLPFTKEKQAALQVTANPKSTIFLNGEHIGSSPFFDDKIKPGEYRIKLVPEAGGQQVLSWEGQVKLVGGVLTVISRDLGESEDKSSGYVLSLEPKVDKNTASVAVVTVPDGAVVSVDGEPKGFAPLNVDSVAEGEHTLIISSPGYVEKSIKAKVVKGYKLTASVQLAKMPPEPEEEQKEATASASPSPSTSPKPSASRKPTATASPKGSPRSSPTTDDSGMTKPYVLIKNPTDGYANVRSKPVSGADVIVGKVNDGEKFKYLATESGYYKIEYDEGKVGWVSTKYAELYK